MKRTFLLAAVSTIPLLLGSTVADAQTTINKSTSAPLATATSGSISIVSGGSISPTAASSAVTVNNPAAGANAVSNLGSIGFTSVDGATGILVTGGAPGSISNGSSITVTDNYNPTSDTNTGLSTGPFAQGTNRQGLLVTGAFTGNLANLSNSKANPIAFLNTGTILVHGQGSADGSTPAGLVAGVSIQAPVVGDYQSLNVTPATSTAAAIIGAGSISVQGDAGAAPVVGFRIAPTGSITGNVVLGAVSATGQGAQAVDIQGPVSGTINVNSGVSATGYRSATRSQYPQLATKYTAAELEQGGVAMTVGASLGGGLIVSAPPPTAVANSSTTIDLVGGNSVPQDQQSTGSITSQGGAPALVIGSSGASTVHLGVVGASDTVMSLSGANIANMYGFVNQGSISGSGIFDQVNYPNLPASVPGVGLQIGNGGGPTIIDGGIYNSGTIGGVAYQGNSTAIHLLSGAQTPQIVNDGAIVASSNQQNTATTGVAPENAYGIIIDAGASVSSIVNNSAITANLTGTGGVGGNVGAIIDRSGTVTSITNTGGINAQATQTLLTSPMPVNLSAIDLSTGSSAQTITQSLSSNTAITGSAVYVATNTYTQGQIVNLNGLVYEATTAIPAQVDPIDYPSDWREIGSVTPVINGSVFLGSGANSFIVNAGIVNSPLLNLGPAATAMTVGAGASVTGALEEVSLTPTQIQQQLAGTLSPLAGGSGKLNLTVNGFFSDTNPNLEKIGNLTVGSTGTLLVAADPANNRNTQFVVSGQANLAAGASIGVTLLSAPTTAAAPGGYNVTVISTTPGNLTVSGLNTGVIANAPWLYDVSASATANTVNVSVTQKSQSALGFNNAEYAAINGVLGSITNNPGIEGALLGQTTQAGLKGVYDQLLPPQGQGLFEALSFASQSIGSMTSTTPASVSRVAGTSLWLQEVNERVDRSENQTVGSFTRLFGVVAGVEHMGDQGGAVGLTLAYLNANETDSSVQLGSGVVASILEGGAYYRRSLGRFTIAARAAAGYAWFNDARVFVTSTTNTVTNSTTGTEVTAHSAWGGFYYDGHFSLAYEQPFGRFYARPELSADYIDLNEGSHTETGGGQGFDLNVASRNSKDASGQAILVLGREWGQSSWLRTEIRGGYRDVLSGSVGDTVASFVGGGAPFALAADKSTGGWTTVGFSIKGGSQYSYIALEGDADMRAHQKRFNLRVAGRSIF